MGGRGRRCRAPGDFRGRRGGGQQCPRRRDASAVGTGIPEWFAAGPGDRFGAADVVPSRCNDCSATHEWRWTSSPHRSDTPTRPIWLRSVAAGWPNLRDLPDPAWAAHWRDADAIAAKAVNAVLDEADIGCSTRLARDLVAVVPRQSTLVLGSSQAPRDVGLGSESRAGVRIVANRGVAGIDGTISTAVGVALAAADPFGAPVVALVGDLTFLHDVNGLIIGPHEPRPELAIVVSNNDGGGIFSTLEPGEPQHARAFDRVFGTPHGAMLAGVVEGFGAEHVFVSTAEELAEAITDPGGIRVVEVPTSRTELAPTLDRIARAVKAAL